MNKRLLVISAGLVHPSIPARRRLRELVEGYGRAQAAFTCRVEGLTRLSDRQFDGVVLYFHRRHLSEGALDALDRFVRGGGGLLAIHGASASFKKTPHYFDILGGRFVRHGRIEPYTVQRTGWADSAFRVTEPFTVTDELYIHNYRDDATIHYMTQTKESAEPVVWTRSYGKGRICYLSLGHRAAVLVNPSVRQIIADGLSFILKLNSEAYDE